MHFEGSLTEVEESHREPLYQTLLAGDEPAIEIFLAHPDLASIMALTDDGENPTIGTALRLLRPGKAPLLLAHGGEATKAKWSKFTKDLGGLLKLNDEDSLAQYYGSQPWTAFREEYHKMRVSWRALEPRSGRC